MIFNIITGLIVIYLIYNNTKLKKKMDSLVNGYDIMADSFNTVISRLQNFEENRKNSPPRFIPFDELPKEEKNKIISGIAKELNRDVKKWDLIEEPFSNFIHKSESSIINQLKKHDILDVIKVLRIMQTRENATPEHRRITKITRNFIDNEL